MDDTETVRVSLSSRGPSTSERPLDWKPTPVGVPCPLISDGAGGNPDTFTPTSWLLTFHERVPGLSLNHSSNREQWRTTGGEGSRDDASVTLYFLRVPTHFRWTDGREGGFVVEILVSDLMWWLLFKEVVCRRFGSYPLIGVDSLCMSRNWETLGDLYFG